LTPAQLLVFFLKLLPQRTLLQLPALQGKRFYNRLFTPLVTLWYLLFQRLNADHSLDAALSDARAGGGNALNCKLSRKLLSGSTASYSDARQRLPWQFLLQVLGLAGQKITQLSQASWKGLAVALLDGTTVRLRPYVNIPQQFTPQRNQYRKPYWCLMRVVVNFCCFTGAAWDCAMDSMSLSEQALAAQIILRTCGCCLFVGDRNFGVFRIVQAIREKGHHLLVRLRDKRAGKLLGRALRPGDYLLSWTPTDHDQLESTFSKAPAQGRLLIVHIKRPGFRSQRICLFTTLLDQTRYSLEELLELYGLRWHIELDLRYVKSQMDAGQLEAHSADSARKEWLACLLAYNLIRAAMLCAALQKGIPPLTLSFSASCRRLNQWLHRFGRSKSAACRTWKITLRDISKCSLPKRSKPRPSEPRAQRHLRAAYPPLFGSRANARRKRRHLHTKS
jgi:hypothetical protein